MAQPIKRIGPNPYVREILSHGPRIVGWSVALTAFFCWPMIGKGLNKAGIWNL